jgi:hypothetical protein
MEHVSAPVLASPRTVEATTEESTERRPVHVSPTTIARFTPPIHSALSLLMDAATCAHDVGAEIWQFSVEISALLRTGLTTNECRWLVAKGLAKHACEMTTPESERRVFQPCTNLALPKRTCFVITDRGMACSAELLRSAAKRQPNDNHNHNSHATVRPNFGNGEPHVASPTWDSDRQQLRVGRIIVKEFKVPAANQEAILAAFQEEGWCPRIDDPLAPKLNQDSKRRLHDTINSLNRNQKHALIRFLGDGKGEGVRWSFVERRTTEHGVDGSSEPHGTASQQFLGKSPDR